MTLLGQMLLEDGMKKVIAVVKAEGKAEGKADSIVELLNELEPVENGLKDMLFQEKNPQILTRWLKAAAKSHSIDEFMRRCGIHIK